MLKSAYLYAEDVALASGLCRPLLKRGMTVAVQLGDPAQADRLLAELPEELGKSCMPVIASDRPDSIDTISEIVGRAAESLQGLDVYIHAVGWEDEASLLKKDPAGFGMHIERRLRQLFLYCRSAGQIMTRLRKGQMIIPLLSDVLHASGFPSSPVYNQAAIAFVRSLAKELSPFGVTVNALEFGYCRDSDSPSSRQWRRQFDIFALRPHVPEFQEAAQGIGLLLDYGHGMSGQTVHLGIGIPSSTI